MNWFNDHGDKLLIGIASAAGALAQAGVASPWIGGVVAVTGVLHTLFWPNNPSPPTGK